MSRLILPPAWPVAPALTRARPSLWDRCIVALPMWQDRPRNVVEGAFTTAIGPPTLVATPRGYGLNFNGTNQGLSYPAVFQSNRISASFIFRRMAAETETKVLLELSANFNAVTRSFSIFQISGDLMRVSVKDQTGLYFQRDYPLPAVGKMVFVTAIFEHNGGGASGNVSLWQDGVEQSGILVRNDSFITSGAFAAETVYLAARGGLELESRVQISSFTLHDRLLSEVEIKALHADPFGMFAPDAGAIAALTSDVSVSGTISRSTAIAASSVVAASGAVTRPRAASISASATVAVIATRTMLRTAVVSSESSVTAAASRTISRSASITAQSGLTATAASGLGRAATISATSGVTAQASVTRHRTASVAGQGAVAATRTLTIRRTVSIAAASSLSASTSGVTSRAVSIEAASGVSVIALLTKRRAASVTATSAAQAVAGRVLSRTVQVDAAGTLTAVSLRTLTRTVSIAANSTVSAITVDANPVALFRDTAIWDEPRLTATWDEPRFTALWRE